MNVSYRALFTIEMLHEYFADGKCQGLEIIPAAECVAICKKMNIQVRTYENKLQAFIRENENGEPFGNTDKGKYYHQYYDATVFRFYVRLNNADFENYTNVEYSFSGKKVFYFSNIANNEVNGWLYLSSPVKDYTAGITYVPGNIVKDPADGNSYECIKKHVAANITKKKNPLSDTGLWTPKGLLHLQKPVEEFVAGRYYKQGDIVVKQDTSNVYESLKVQTSKDANDLDNASLWIPRGEGQLQYVTGNDSTVFCGDHYDFEASAPVSTATVDIFKFNFSGDKPDFKIAAVDQQQLTFKTPVTSVPVRLTSLVAGMYKIKVNEETAMVYHDPMLSTGRIIGVIEIFNHLSPENNYALLDKAEKIRSTRYWLHFANRRILWKYVRKDGKAKHIVDTSNDTKYVFNLNGDDFVSEIPIPLTQSAVKTLKLEFNTKEAGLQPLPNPRIEHIRKYNQDDFDYYCGEVYLNY